MMKLCKTCKWWREEEKTTIFNDILHPRAPDTYEVMEMPFIVKVCISPKLLFYERPVESTDTCVVDGSEYIAHLITAEDFGCVNHEAE